MPCATTWPSRKMVHWVSFRVTANWINLGIPRRSWDWNDARRRLVHAAMAPASGRRDLGHLVGEQAPVFVGDADVLAHGEAVLAEAEHRFLARGLAVLVVEVPALALMHEAAVAGVFIGRETAHGAGLARLGEGGGVQMAVRRERRHQR